MFVKQLSVFLENREGRLEEALRILKDNDINIISLSLADTSDFGLRGDSGFCPQMRSCPGC